MSPSPLATAASPSPAWLPVLATRPGRTLAHRLSFPSELARNVVVTLGALFYVALGMAVCVVAMQGFALGEKRFGFFFALVALLMLLSSRAAMRTLQTALAAPQAVLEVSLAAVRPGEPFALHVEQPRAAGLSSLTVSLVCEEIATRAGGKSAATKRHVVFERVLVSAQPAAEGRSGPFLHFERCKLPPDAMHSFEGRRNRIQWKIVVAATTLRGVEVRREAPLVVLPAKPQRPRGGYRDPGHGLV